MSYNLIRVATDGPITTITLNRPEVMNAVNPEMHAELERAFDAFAADDSQRIGVVTGAGERAFCAGSDLKAMAASGGLASIKYPRHGYAGMIERFDLNKPLIAAVNGVAFGGGFEIAMTCDIVIAADQAKFGLPEPLVGAVALGSGIHRLSRQIGLKHAMGILLTSDSVTAAEGLRMGFVNEVVPLADLDATVANWCQRILRGAPSAITATKETAMRGLDEPSLAEAIANQRQYPAFAAWISGEDIQEGPRAFADKRKPNWLKD
jgi:enoyl-CoA hydratase/carnithine racemase